MPIRQPQLILRPRAHTKRAVKHIVIMAGGSGTRFWPKSRSHHPKQFLPIGSEHSLIQHTVDRVRTMVPPERIWVVTGEAHSQHAIAMLPELPEANILIEPVGRNTAACIGWASLHLLARDPEAQLAVLPADHFIGDVPGFQRHLSAAFEAAKAHIVLFGIIPTEPNTGYGYIQRGASLAEVDALSVCEVVRFVEKPNTETAMAYLASGDYLWNSGMFVFPAALMAEELATFLPDLKAGLDALMKAPDAISTLYPELEAVSIDVGVMERSKATRVMPASFAWSDVGSWDAAASVHEAGAGQNVLLGQVIEVKSERCFVDARSGRTVAVVGLSDVIVVDTEDAILVCRKGASQSVKDVVDALKASGQSDLL